MIILGHCVIINLGHCLSGLYTMRLVGMRVVDPIYTTIRKRCFNNRCQRKSFILKRSQDFQENISFVCELLARLYTEVFKVRPC